MSNPLNDDLLQLNQEEEFLRQELQKLHSKREALARQREEEERQKAMSREIEVRVTRFVQGRVYATNSDYRQDVVAAQQKIPSRSYNGGGENSYVAEHWSLVKAAMNALPNVKIVTTPVLEKEITEYINAPMWSIELGIRQFECKAGPKAYLGLYSTIPGATFLSDRKKMYVPISEGWRLWTKLQELVEKEQAKIEWSSGAQKIIVRQLEQRASLDKIAMMERGIIYKDFTMGAFTLRPFQEVGAEFVEATQGRALLGYEMGLGKTIISLAYAVKNGYKTVVVCPASLKANWCREIFKATGKHAFVLSGSEPSRYEMVKLLTEMPQITLINYDILAKKSKTTEVTKDQEGYTHEKREARFLWVDLINLAKPDLIISDESHYIKNTDSNRSEAVRKLKSPHFLMMTGTPVLNRPGELWPMLNVLQPEQFPAFETFLRQYTYDGKTARNVEELRQILRTVMIRRTRKDVDKDLPPINRIQQYHDLSPKALKLYRKIENGIYETISDYSVHGQGGFEMGVASILAMIQRLKMVCAIDKVEHIVEQARELYEQTDESGYRKVLIFSQFKGTAYKIAKLLGPDALCFVRKGAKDFVTANDQERDRLVQQFQNDPNIKWLIVTEKTAKEGHNITAAGHVIFNDPFWTPAAHDQAEGRAYGRQSDSHGINSYYHTSTIPGSDETEEESIEEWIEQLLLQKLQVIEEVVEGVEASRDVSIINELIGKLRDRMGARKFK